MRNERSIWQLIVNDIMEYIVTRVNQPSHNDIFSLVTTKGPSDEEENTHNKFLF